MKNRNFRPFIHMLVFTFGTFIAFIFLPFWTVEEVKRNPLMLFLYLYMANVAGVYTLGLAKAFLERLRKWLEFH